MLRAPYAIRIRRAPASRALGSRCAFGVLATRRSGTFGRRLVGPGAARAGLVATRVTGRSSTRTIGAGVHEWAVLYGRGCRRAGQQLPECQAFLMWFTSAKATEGGGELGVAHAERSRTVERSRRTPNEW
ncbi:hypothetical protein GOPIP_001_00080 [Gordonia polyisoprenivorans NBRC 16320 = JCM 10675]|nr:hypothetical protein GOPIP_001_00080 [Gordonia polyisoprenivorans NBRC 16320 = JCM 10675]